MTSPIHEASARQRSGEPFSGLSPNDARKDRLRNPDLAEVDGKIARLVDRSTQELRRAWRTLYHTGLPLGLSRDLIIRGLADKLQQRAHGGPSRALQRRLRILTGEFEKGAGSFDPGGVLKTGASLVRRWRGHTQDRFAPDSPLEGNGFELSVPGTKEPVFVAEGELRDRTGSQKGCFVCGTDGSNPSPSSGESATNCSGGGLDGAPPFFDQLPCTRG
jgi:Protein of unknown function (DUF2924)